jgi:hypothetical protein
MQIEKELLEIERGLWTNDAAYYGENLVEEAMLVFAETGPITRETAVDAIRAENAEGRRWAEVRFDEVRGLRLSDDAHLLSYKVTARWEHELSSGQWLASSVYVRRDAAWKLAFHQQTPVQASESAAPKGNDAR